MTFDNICMKLEKKGYVLVECSCSSSTVYALNDKHIIIIDAYNIGTKKEKIYYMSIKNKHIKAL